MRAQDVGIPESELVLGKHSGRHAFGAHLAKMGFHLKDAELEKAYERFIALADKKKTVYDDDLVSIVQSEIDETPQVYTLDYLHVSAGTGTVPTATVRLRKDNEVIQDAACGDGPVDAALKTIDRIAGVQGRLLDYALQAVTRGKDAVGEVSVQVAFGDEIIVGKGSSTDIVEASAKAYLNGLNRYLCGRQKPAVRRRRKTPARKKAAK